MASRRQGTQLLTSIYRAVEAQLAATSNQLHAPSQLTSLYAEVVRPQQLTSLRNFGTAGTPAFNGTFSIAEAATSNSAKAAAKGPRKPRASTKTGSASVPDLAAAAEDTSQLAKLPKKPRSTKAKPTNASISELAEDASKLAKPARKARSSEAKPTNALIPESVEDASKLAKPARKARSSTAKSTNAFVSERADDAPQLAKPIRKARSTTAKMTDALVSESADDASQLAKPTRKARSSTAKTTDALVSESSDDAAQLAKPTRKARLITAKTSDALVSESTDEASQRDKPPRKPRSTTPKSAGALVPESAQDASQVAKLPRKPHSTTPKAASRKTASSSEMSDLSDVPHDTSEAPKGALGSVGSAVRPYTAVQASKQSHSQAQQTAVLASQGADTAPNAHTDRAQSGNEADAEISYAKEKRRSKREATVSRSKSKAKGEAAPARVVLPSYKQLKANGPTQSLAIPYDSRRAIKMHMRAFKGSAYVQDQALALYVNSQLFYQATNELEAFIFKAATQELVDALVAAEPGPAAQDALFGLFADYMVQNYSAELQSYRTRVQTVDMRKSHKWYPMARSLQRRIIYHAGPTNSGKTYQALKAMREAKTGVYCGPLRLLAMEVFDSVNQQGIHCNLHTGQERQVLAGAKHVSCTIEMASTTRRWDCAVIDEIQMIGDDQRGWAWTRAVQGLPANEIHLCGDASALPLIKQMCDDMAEPLTVVHYNRFTDLEIQPRALEREYASVEPGDCVVAFSRRDIFDIKADIERRTNHKCCVIYGALPPEMRRHQAELFNEPNNGFDILVASDAVGMGLNLNIRRVIFHKVQKFEGKDSVQVSPSQIKQIAGRAGRRNSLYPKGFVGTRAPADLPAVINAVNMPLDQLSTPAAGLFPEFQHLELLAGQVPNDSFAQLLNRFSDEAKLEGTFFFCRQDGVMQIAKLLEKVDNLSLEDRFDFCMAPANIRDARMGAALLHFAARYAHGLPATLDIALPHTPPTTAEELRHVEATHQLMSLWIWLSHRFGPEAFPGLETVAKQSEALIMLMDRGLEQMCAWNKRKGRSGDTAGRAKFSQPSTAALLLQHEPLALAYLANSRGQKFINSYEWTEPAAELNEMAYGGQRQ